MPAVIVPIAKAPLYEGIIAVVETPAFYGGAPPLDDILLDLMLPDMDVLGIYCRGYTTGQLNGDLWFCCYLFISVVKY